MNQRNKLKFLILFIVVPCIIFGKGTYKPRSLSSTFIIGHDSNPLRLSQNEIDQLSEKPYLLGAASEIYSRFLGISGKFSFYSKKAILARLFKEKTSFSLGYTYKNFTENKKKSSRYFTFKIDQQLGDYKHLYINYSLMPDYYLREYEDLDYIIVTNNIENISRYFSCMFDIEKLHVIYQKPLRIKGNKVKVGAFFERQIFDSYFTEFDLNIVGQTLEFSFNNDDNYFSKKRTVNLLYEKHIADNSTFLNELLSTLYMNRDYKQSRYKLSFKQSMQDAKSFGFTIDIYKRNNTSKITTDQLHYRRKHTDKTISVWYKKDRYKIMLSKRRRGSYSPFNWVKELKTFDRYIVTLTTTLAKKKF